MRWVMHAKIHKAIVVQADLDYVGSVTIDEDLMDMVGFWKGEKVLIVSNTSGARLETYIIPGKRGSGDIFINGAAAHLIKAGEEVIIIGFELTDKPLASKAILVDKQNRFVKYLNEKAGERAE